MTEPGSWIAWLIALPFLGMLLSFLLPGRWVAVITAAAVLGALFQMVPQLVQSGPLHHAPGGWSAPLGIELYIDGLSAAMLLMTGIVSAVATCYAWGYFSKEKKEKNTALFWPLWLGLWTALNALFTSHDIFTVYVSLELMGLSAAGLVALAGGPALVASMRYLLASLLASALFLMGVGLLYGAFGVLDMDALQVRLVPGISTWTAAALMSAGLFLKGALFPLHVWLPSAHASAPAPVSAALSALVVKAAFYLLLRLWFSVFPLAETPAVHLMGILGAGAIVWGSLMAFRQTRLKLLVAYSTVAQIGYLFLIFPMAGHAGWAADAWRGGVFYALVHAFSKSAAFLAAGTVLFVRGDDRIQHLKGFARQAPMTAFAFGLAAIALMGLPPSGGFVGKWMLLTASLQTGQWWWAIAIITGGFLAAAYWFRVLQQFFANGDDAQADASANRPPRIMEFAALTLSLIGIGLGLASYWPLALIGIQPQGMP